MATSRSINMHLRLKPREAKRWRAAAKQADETVSEWVRTLCNEVSEPRETKRWRAAAKRAGKTINEWIRNVCNRASETPPPSIPPVISGDQIELPLSERAKKPSP